MRFPRLKSVVIGAALAALALTPLRAEPLPDTIRFGGFGQGYGQPYGVALLAVAQVKGFIADEFKDTPVKFEWTYFTGTGPAINEAIANGRLDFAQYGGLPNIVGRANGLPTHLVSSYGTTNVIGAARTGLPIASIKDLKGRKVTFSKGTILHWAFLRALALNGLSARDVTIVDLKSADQLAALAAGSVDASISTTVLLALRDQGVVNIFYRSNDIGLKAAGFGAITVTEPFETKYPEATRRVVRGLARAAEWLSHEENREEALQIWTKSGTPYAALKEDFAGVSLKDAFNPLIDDFLVAQYRDAIQFSKDEKLIRNDIDLKTWVAPSYLDAALKELGFDHYWPHRSADGAVLN